jgi:glycosyltransferase involved in cell wall biosynthesis
VSIQISVVVCTYNRADLLAGALQSLCEQNLDPSEYEIIVVDNNSSDNTRAIVREFCQGYTNVSYCFEPQQGLSHARNRGWQEARGEYVGYIDDDGKAPEQWLTVAKETIEQKSPAVFGGPYYAFYNTPKPCWFKDAYGSCVKTGGARLLTPHEYLSGGNIFVRRFLLQSLGGFDADLGMAGQKMAYGEETSLLRRMRVSMPNEVIYYDPKLYVYHLVRPEKMTLPRLVRESFVRGRYSYRAWHDDNRTHTGWWQMLWQTAATVLVLGAHLVPGLLLRDRGQYHYPENFLFERVLPHVRRLGMLYEQHRQHG